MQSPLESAITDVDRSVLGPLAEHRVLIVPQVAHLLDVTESTAARRLRRLQRSGLVEYQRVFSNQPAAAWITRRGLDAIEHQLPAPRIDLRGYRHDVGVGWLWMAAHAGVFGAATAVTSEREMRASDARSGGDAIDQGRAREPFGVGLGILNPHGQPKRHYADLMLDTRSGHRVAVELELTAKSRGRMSRIMRAYASDAHVDAVLYLVPTAAIARLVTDAARQAGIADLVHVQRLAPDAIKGAPAHALDRAGARTRSGSRSASPTRTGALQR
jgi:hypothetical protein